MEIGPFLPYVGARFCHISRSNSPQKGYGPSSTAIVHLAPTAALGAESLPAIDSTLAGLLFAGEAPRDVAREVAAESSKKLVAGESSKQVVDASLVPSVGEASKESADASRMDASRMDASRMDASLMDASLMDASLMDASLMDTSLMDKPSSSVAVASRTLSVAHGQRVAPARAGTAHLSAGGARPWHKQVLFCVFSLTRPISPICQSLFFPYLTFESFF